MKPSTPSFMVYGETGRYPLEIDINIRMISYWAKFVTGKQSKLSNILYNLSLFLCNLEGKTFVWLDHIRNIFNNCGLSFIWDTQTFINTEWLLANLRQILKDQFIQNWKSLVTNSPKALNYRLFKESFEFQEYMNILEDNYLIELCRFRTLNHKLPIESGRWVNIQREMRKCQLCAKNEIGDEFHYV